MRWLRADFAGNTKAESWYDLREDWDLIESSLAKQYGVRMRREADMPWDEFTALVGGLMPDTPLGSIVAIRSEKDQKVIKGFSPDQKRIYNDWRRKSAKKQMSNPQDLSKRMDNLALILQTAFGGSQ